MLPAILVTRNSWWVIELVSPPITPLAPASVVEFTLARLMPPHSPGSPIDGSAAAKVVPIIETPAGSPQREMRRAKVAAPEPRHGLHWWWIEHFSVGA